MRLFPRHPQLASRGPALLGCAIVLALAGCAAPRPSPAPVSGPRQCDNVPERYRIRPGDTLFRISWEFCLNYRDIARWNRLRNPDLIIAGRDLWLVMSAGTRQPDGSFTGELYRTSGPAFASDPFTPIGAGYIATVGTMSLRFSDGNNGTLTYTYNGVTVTKAITRQLFSSPVPLCN